MKGVHDAIISGHSIRAKSIDHDKRHSLSLLLLVSSRKYAASLGTQT